MRPLLSLVMMVKNEGKCIREVLESALPHVDRVTILDTGSTDDTIAIAREVLNGKPHTTHEAAFERYDTTRNRALDLDRDTAAAHFQLMLSGDEYLHNGEELRRHLEEHRESDVDAHLVRLTIGNKRQYQIRVTRTGSAWRYKSNLPLGLHENPINNDESAKFVAVPGATIEHRPTDPEDRLRNVLEVHIPALEAAIAEEPQHAEALFYLAQSWLAVMEYFDFSQGEKDTIAMQAMSYYKRRLALPGNDVVHNFCEMQYLECARIAGVYNNQELYARLVKLYERDPNRPEVVLQLAHAAMKAIPLDKVYELFSHAAKVCQAAETIDNASPVATNGAIEAHYYAALMARQLAAKKDAEKYSPLVREHMSAGMKAGGTWEIFKNLVAEAPSAQQS